MFFRSFTITTSLEEEGEVTFSIEMPRVPLMISTRYSVILLPPLYAGGSHLTISEVAPVDTEILGEPGASIFIKKTFIIVCADTTRRYGVVFGWLQQQLGNTLHRHARKLFCHDRVIVFDIDSQ